MSTTEPPVTSDLPAWADDWKGLTILNQDRLIGRTSERVGELNFAVRRAAEQIRAGRPDAALSTLEAANAEVPA